MRWFNVVALGLAFQSLCGCSERPSMATPVRDAQVGTEAPAQSSSAQAQAQAHDAQVQAQTPDAHGGTPMTVDGGAPRMFEKSKTSTLTQVQELKFATLTMQSDVVAIKEVIEYHRIKAIKAEGQKKGWAKKPPTKPGDVVFYQEWQQVQQISLPANPPKL